MAETQPQPPETNQTSWVRYRILLAAGLILVMAVIVMGVRWLASPPSDQGTRGDQSLEAQWNKTIEQLGIEPVYPPAEDLTVGDLLAEVAGDDEQDPNAGWYVGPAVVRASTPLLRKSVKLAHIDVTKELNEVYAELPFFPEEDVGITSGSAPSSAAAGDNPATPRASGLRFKSDGSRTALPRAAFPGLTIYHSGSAAAGVSATGYGFFRFGASSEDSQKLEVRLVETYGLPSVVADRVLTAYCNAEKTRSDACSEKTARKHLQALVGDRVLACYVDRNTGKLVPAVTVRVFIVGRVYLAHSITSQSINSRAEAGAGQAAPKASSSEPETTSKGPTASIAGETSAGRNDALDKRLDEVEKQLKDLLQGAAVTYRSGSERNIQLDQTFPRGLVIGYRSVPLALGNNKPFCEESTLTQADK
jgi:hypothetical protein